MVPRPHSARLRVLLTSVHAWPEVVRGGERYLHELAGALHRAGHEVRVVASAERPHRDHVEGVPVDRWPQRALLPGRFGDQAVEVGFGAQCLRLVGTRTDVWHATSTGDAATAALCGRVRPRLATVFTDHGFPAARSRRRRADRRLHQVVVDQIGAYVCVSPAAGEWLRRDYGRDPVVVPPGVRLDRYAPGPRSSRPTLLYVGSLAEPRKRVGALLAAADVLRDRVPDLQVRLLGPGDPAALLDGPGGDLVTDVRRVDPSALAEAYASAWATVLPSTAESFGMVVVESLASGTPAVVVADGGGPTALVEAGRTGAIADDAGPTALAAACAQALDLAAAPATVEACREAARGYDWDTAVVPRMEQVYADAA